MSNASYHSETENIAVSLSMIDPEETPGDEEDTEDGQHDARDDEEDSMTENPLGDHADGDDNSQHHNDPHGNVPDHNACVGTPQRVCVDEDAYGGAGTLLPCVRVDGGFSHFGNVSL